MENQNINLIENENKSTKSKLLTWVATILLGALVGFGAILSTISPRFQKSSAYSVNESQNYVEFSAYELNNYTFVQLESILSGNTDDSTYIIYNNETFNYSSYNMYEDYDNFSHRVFLDSGKFFLTFDDEESYSEFEYSLYWYSSYIVENIQKYVTLTASELNNNHYEYLANQINSLESGDNSFTGSSIVYNDMQFYFDDLVLDDGVYFTSEVFYMRFYLDNTLDYYSTFVLTNPNGDVLPFSDSITIYSDYIVDNLYAPNTPTTWLDDIIALLTGGIVGLSGGIGSGVSTLVSDIFISNNALSVMGGMIVVFAAISLAIGLCRWVMNFLTSLGAKK